jgi:hypothetical protein
MATSGVKNSKKKSIELFLTAITPHDQHNKVNNTSISGI